MRPARALVPPVRPGVCAYQGAGNDVRTPIRNGIMSVADDPCPALTALAMRVTMIPAGIVPAG